MKIAATTPNTPSGHFHVVGIGLLGADGYAAKRLGWGRNTLTRKLKELHIEG